MANTLGGKYTLFYAICQLADVLETHVANALPNSVVWQKPLGTRETSGSSSLYTQVKNEGENYLLLRKLLLQHILNYVIVR